MKSILLIGLGRFGRHIAQELNELGHQAVSYTHLDVYKRQVQQIAAAHGGTAVFGQNTPCGAKATVWLPGRA